MKSLRAKILTVLFGILVLSNLIIYLISVKGISSAMYEEITGSLERTVHSISNAVRDNNEVEWKGIETLALNPTIRDPDVPLIDKAKITYAAMKGNKTYLDVAITDLDGKSWINGGEKLISFAERDYVQEALKGNKYVCHPFKNKVTGLMSVFYSVPVYDEHNKIINAVFCIVDGYHISDLVRDNPVSSKRTAYIINRKNYLTVAAGNNQDVEEAYNLKTISHDQDKAGNSKGFEDVIDKICKGGKGNSTFWMEGDTHYVFFEEVPDTPWSVWTAIPTVEFEDDVKAMKMRLLGTFLASGLIVIIILAVALGMSIKPLKVVQTAISGIASGNADLTNRIEVHSNDEIGGVVKGFNAFMEKLQDIVSKIMGSKGELASAGTQLDMISQTTSSTISRIMNDIKTVNGHIETQNTSVNQTTAAVGEITENINSLEKMIESQSSGVAEASAAVEEMIGNISSVNKSVEKMVTSFQSLAENAKTGITLQSDVNDRISQIESQSEMLVEANAAIAAIAEQTNLLAMNAAIEAAHAGDAGKGFSVVADEIRKLSETSTLQSKSIGDELNKIKGSIEAVVTASTQSNGAFQSVAEKINETDQLVRQIKSAMEEQEEGSHQINDALHAMNDSTIEVRTAAAEMSEGNKSILSEVENLKAVNKDMNQSVSSISHMIEDISANGETLAGVSKDINIAIDKIGGQIDMFKV